ncbi:MAG: hypothetical protein AAF658_08440, partial [Myxococcota bacterium]
MRSGVVSLALLFAIGCGSSDTPQSADTDTPSGTGDNTSGDTSSDSNDNENENGSGNGADNSNESDTGSNSNNTNDTDVTPCASGTWDDDSAPETACVAWTNCVPGEEIATEGTATTDRVCAACTSGYTDVVNAPNCLAWSDCAAGTTVSAEPTPTEDRECQPCATGTWNDQVNALVCTSQIACGLNQTESIPGSATANPVCEAGCINGFMVGYPGDGNTCRFRDAPGFVDLPKLAMDERNYLEFFTTPDTPYAPEDFRAPGTHPRGCGACLEVTGPNGSVVAIVNEVADVGAVGNNGRANSVHVQTSAILEISDSQMVQPAAMRPVPCPVTGNIQLK